MNSKDEFARQIEELGRISVWVDAAKVGQPFDDLPDIAGPNDAVSVTTETPVGVAELVSDDPSVDVVEMANANGEVSKESDAAGIARRVAFDDRLDHLPESERPRERMHELGAAGITTTELLAILLGTGKRGRNVKNVADDLLREFETLRGLSRATPFNMQNVGGVGEVKADILTAAFELGRRAAHEEIELSETEYGIPMPTGDQIALSVAKRMDARLRDARQEEMWVVFLDVRNRYRGRSRLYVGCCDQLVAKTGEILSRIVERNYPRFALVHNHPSGDGSPSGADINFTERLVRASDLLDIEMMDHVVLGENLQSYVSMRNNRLVDFNGTIRVNRKIMERRDYCEIGRIS